MLKKINELKPAIPVGATIQSLTNEKERPKEHHDFVTTFLTVDAIASGIEKDFQFLLRIPKMLEEIIETKKWENFCVTKGVASPIYCGYTSGSDRENFVNFIEAKRPYGLGTDLKTLDLLLSIDPLVQMKYRDFLGLS